METKKGVDDSRELLELCVEKLQALEVAHNRMNDGLSNLCGIMKESIGQFRDIVGFMNAGRKIPCGCWVKGNYNLFSTMYAAEDAARKEAP